MLEYEKFDVNARPFFEKVKNIFHPQKRLPEYSEVKEKIEKSENNKQDDSKPWNLTGKQKNEANKRKSKQENKETESNIANNSKKQNNQKQENNENIIE